MESFHFYLLTSRPKLITIIKSIYKFNIEDSYAHRLPKRDYFRPLPQKRLAYRQDPQI